MKIVYFLLALATLVVSCNAPRQISTADFIPAGYSEATTPGLYYHLPATVIKVEVTAQKAIEKRGPYYRYSQRYLNLSDIITEDNTEWNITDARIYSEGIPDHGRLFRITSEGTPAGAAVSLTPDGILKGFNLSSQEIMTQEKTASSAETKESVDISFDDIPFLEEQLIKTSSAATAEEVANEIYRLRESRRRLLESDMQNLPPDEGAYKLTLQEIDQMEQQYLSLFKGKKQTETVRKTFTFLPEASTQINEVLFRFSSQKGFADVTDMTGTPVYVDIQTDSIPKRQTLSIPEDDNIRSGMVYCKPVKATLKIIDRTTLLNQKEVLIGQFGSLHQLPASLLDNPGTTLKLDPNTGAIIEIQTKQ